MTIGKIKRMSGNDINNLYKKLPEPHYSIPINTDRDSLETILDDFNKRKPTTKEHTAIQNDLVALAKKGKNLAV